MALAVGTRLSPYEAVAPIGAGGIGDVLFSTPPGPKAFGISSDGQKFVRLTTVAATSGPPSPITVVLNCRPVLRSRHSFPAIRKFVATAAGEPFGPRRQFAACVSFRVSKVWAISIVGRQRRLPQAR